jgi:TPR repeat protein
MSDEKRKEILQSIVNSIERARIEEDQEMLIEAIESIPEDFWKDSNCSITIMDSFFSRISSEFFVYPIEFIPKDFWKDEGLAWAYAVTLSHYYQDGNINYNMSELLPLRLLANKDIAKLFLYANYIETIRDIPNELMGDSEMIREALDGIDFAIEQHESLGSMVCPLDVDEYLRALLDQIPNELASNKDFVLDIISEIRHRYSLSENIGVLLSWIDKSLWSDREFAVSVLSDTDVDAMAYVAEEFFEDEEFVDALKDWFDIYELGCELIESENATRGIALILSAAKEGNEDAQFRIAEMYKMGEGVEKNPAEALKWHRIAAENGSSEAQLYLAEIYRYGKGVEKNLEKSLEWYKLAAEGGNHDAMSTLGFMYYRGDGVEKDYNEAYYWFKKDGFRGLPYLIYADMCFYVDKDYKNAFHLYCASLKQGVEEAGYKIGEMYYYGLGVAQDYNEAFKFLKYYNGEFEEEYFDWAPARVHYMLSEMYQNGWGVQKNTEEAEKLRRAAEKGEDY